jgi:hypothetical protein
MADGTPRIVSPFARPAVSNDTPPPYAYEMIDAPSEPRSTVAGVSDAVKGATQTKMPSRSEKSRGCLSASSAISHAKRHAFLLGVAVARFHSNSR